ncbi:MAG: hypothetical protein ABIG31_04965 [Candidatus Omnitrophota bacterium]
MRKFFIVLTVLFMACGLCFAKDAKKAKKQPKESATPAAAVQQQPPVINKQEEKDLLIANVNNMRNQELRAAVVQQLLNEEIAKLGNLQSVFCDQYKLDVDKFRKGLYRYDENTGKFEENEAQKTE